MSRNETESNPSQIISLLASAGGILLFALILWLTYLPTHSEKADATLRLEREQKLSSLRAGAADVLQNYDVISAADGIYRIPIDKAMQLTVETYQQ